MKYLMYALWFLTIIVGRTIANTASVNSLYNIGFVAEAFATMFFILGRSWD